MAGDEFRARRYLLDDLADVLRQSFDVATTLQIDKRKPPSEEVVTEVNHV